MLDESLTVNCGASGRPPPEIEITDQTGLPLPGNHLSYSSIACSYPDDEFKVAGQEMTIERLSKHHQGTVIKCLAVQDLVEHDTTMVEERQVIIDVWRKQGSILISLIASCRCGRVLGGRV
jgi:hypothetical protein